MSQPGDSWVKRQITIQPGRRHGSGEDKCLRSGGLADGAADCLRGQNRGGGFRAGPRRMNRDLPREDGEGRDHGSCRISEAGPAPHVWGAEMGRQDCLCVTWGSR